MMIVVSFAPKTDIEPRAELRRELRSKLADAASASPQRAKALLHPIANGAILPILRAQEQDQN
jgi:hypothetical protein